jgi:predicted extracellular nuclease
LSRIPIRRARRLGVLAAASLALLLAALPAAADTSAQSLPFSQNWTNTGQITADDDWSGVAGIVGYLGDDSTTMATGVDPQTRLEGSWSTTADVIANQTNPNSLFTGGVAEFHLADPVVALQGSGTADAPNLVVNLTTSGQSNIGVEYKLRDIDGSADNAVQPVALQYRVGSTGNFTNVPAAFVPDATTGPSLATQTTAVDVALPAAVDNQPLVQLRIITANAAGSDEWVGVDDISVAVLPPETAPQVSSTTPANGATDVALDANVTITFDEPVNVGSTWFEIACSLSGTHTATQSGGPQTFTLDPSANFHHDESCTVTIDDAKVSDQDVTDPPDTMDADFSFTFTTAAIPVHIYEVQGAGHISPYVGRRVSVPGIVTAVRPISFYIQDATGDSNDATSDGILVFVGASTPGLAVGQAVSVAGTVTEFQSSTQTINNLRITQLTSPTVTLGGPGVPIAPTVIGAGGRAQPNAVIENDADGDLSTTGTNDFDPAQDGIDFYESLENMLVQVGGGAVVNATRSFGEITVLPDNGAGATGLRTPRGGILAAPTDFNPERVIVDDEILRDQISPRPIKAMPDMNVGARITSPIIGPLDYSFANFKIQAMTQPSFTPSTIVRETAMQPHRRDLTVATFNVENLHPGDPQAKFDDLARLIVNNLRAPAILGLEEVQDNNGPTNDSVVDASVTYAKLIDAITIAGGPRYAYRQIDPVDDQDGGQPGGNIRVALLFRTDLRQLSFVDRPGGGPAVESTVVGKNNPRLSSSPGRIGTQSPAFDETRKSLVGEFVWRGRTVFVIVNHFSSKNDDQPLYGRFQPPTRFTEGPRHGQAQVVNDFVDRLLALERKANVVVLGDINDFEFSQTIEILEGGVLTTLMDILPPNERYSYVFEGNSQVLDQILVSDSILKRSPKYDVVHVNSEFADAIQASDHEPQVAYLRPAGSDDDEGDDD